MGVCVCGMKHIYICVWFSFSLSLNTPPTPARTHERLLSLDIESGTAVTTTWSPLIQLVLPASYVRLSHKILVPVQLFFFLCSSFSHVQHSGGLGSLIDRLCKAHSLSHSLSPPPLHRVVFDKTKNHH